MPIREIPGYSDHATGNGCYFTKTHQLLIQDAATGHERRERVFTTDAYITVDEFETIIEFSERFAIEISGALGWTSQETSVAKEALIVDLTAKSNDALRRMDEAEKAGLINMRQASEAITRLETSEARTAELELAAKDYDAKMSALNRKVNAAERKVKKLEA
jgi:hypothetical protein